METQPHSEKLVEKCGIVKEGRVEAFPEESRHPDHVVPAGKLT